MLKLLLNKVCVILCILNLFLFDTSVYFILYFNIFYKDIGKFNNYKVYFFLVKVIFRDIIYVYEIMNFYINKILIYLKLVKGRFYITLILQIYKLIAQSIIN